MKITLENFEEEFQKCLDRMAANVDLEVTDRQKTEAKNCRHSVEINRTFYLHQVKNGTDVLTCTCCGALMITCYSEPIKSQMQAKQICFHCNYWEQLAAKPDPKRLVIDGHIYGDGGNSPGARSDFLGFGGHKWFIERDGKAWETNNLWSGSSVPQAYIEHFPDNAKFLKALP